VLSRKSSPRSKAIRWLKKDPIDAFNQQLKTQGLVPIAIAEIEREVHYLMTR
jgi:hypothetical protein